MTARYRTQIGGLAVDAQFLETAEDELDYALKSAPRGPHLPTTPVCGVLASYHRYCKQGISVNNH